MNEESSNKGCLYIGLPIFMAHVIVFLVILGDYWKITFGIINGLFTSLLLIFIFLCIPIKFMFRKLEEPESIQGRARYVKARKRVPFLCVVLVIYFASFIVAIFGIITSNLKATIIGTIVAVITFFFCLKPLEVLANYYVLFDTTECILICPVCQSPRIKNRFVKGSQTRGHSRTYVSKNINPFKPFTYRNYDTGPVTTTMNYKTIYVCETCGAVFDTPEQFKE